MRTHTLRGQSIIDDALISDAELERLRLITLQHRSRRYRILPVAAPGGSRPSHWRGHGMELHESRPYQAGDDIRHLDWRATARSGKATTKVFVEERARNLFLLIDRRPSMLFGTRRELKAATAARIAAILAFSALAEREAVSGLVLGESAQFFPPSRALNSVLALLRAAAAAAPAPGNGRGTAAYPPVMQYVPQPLERGTACCLISDFHDVLDDRARLEDYLPRMVSGEPPGDVSVIRIVDAAERQLPEAGELRLVSPEGGAIVTIDSGDPELRRRYRSWIVAQDARFSEACGRLDLRLLRISNELDLMAQLDSVL